MGTPFFPHLIGSALVILIPVHKLVLLSYLIFFFIFYVRVLSTISFLLSVKEFCENFVSDNDP